jgi:hypothetical protein
MDPKENTFYFRALAELLTEAELQLQAHRTDPSAERYRELVDELRNALNTAVAASRFILAEIGASAPPLTSAVVAEDPAQTMH